MFLPHFRCTLVAYILNNGSKTSWVWCFESPKPVTSTKQLKVDAEFTKLKGNRRAKLLTSL